MDMVMTEKELTQQTPLIEVVDLGDLHAMEEGIAPSKGCGCSPPTQTPAPTS
jgi:hypothetical protein